MLAMWRVETTHNKTIYPAALAVLAAVIVAAWPDIPDRWRLPTLVAGLGIMAAPFSYWLADLLVIVVPVWRKVEAEETTAAEPVPAPDTTADLARAEMLDFLTRVRAYNADLPADEQDNYRLWTWRDLGISARRWVDLTDRLVEAGLARKTDDGTWVHSTVVELFADIYLGSTPLPHSGPIPLPERNGGGIGGTVRLGG